MTLNKPSRDGKRRGQAGWSIRRSTSIGSPSGAVVRGRNPNSYGNTIPAGSTLLECKDGLLRIEREFITAFQPVFHDDDLNQGVLFEDGFE